MAVGSKMDAVRSLARAGRLIRARDLDALGAPRTYIARLVADGSLARVGRGVYASPQQAGSEHHTLAHVAIRAPRAVCTLLTALRFHQLGSENPWQVWIALPRGHAVPKVEGCALEATWLDESDLARDVERHVIEGVEVQVFTPARAIVECFRFRTKIGLEPCLEALRDFLRREPGGADRLWEVARRRRVSTVLRPYLEALA